MADRLLVGTRKGLFDCRLARHGTWRTDEPALKGLPVPYAMRDPRTGRVWASLDHGHWGSKLARSKDERRQRVRGGRRRRSTPRPPGSPRATTGSSSRVTPRRRTRSGSAPSRAVSSSRATAARRGRSSRACGRFAERHHWMGGGRDDAGIHSIAHRPTRPAEPPRRRVLRRRAGDHGRRRVLGLPQRGRGDRAPARGGLGVRLRPAPGRTQSLRPRRAVAAEPRRRLAQHRRGPHVGGPHAEAARGLRLPHRRPSHAGRDGVDRAHGERRAARSRSTARWSSCAPTTAARRGARAATGLPQANAWDFPFRHALDVSADGETLAFGTTSGNLYVSSDGGRSWQTVTNNLPAVYSVRFA